jgi:metal-responsive CopG/Arc/MetJ family transcriptional regulator
MKTAISIPDQIFNQADILANELGISRSELYSKAIEEFIKERDDEVITEKLNEVYNSENNSLSKDLNKMQFDSIKMSKNEW